MCKIKLRDNFHQHSHAGIHKVTQITRELQTLEDPQPQSLATGLSIPSHIQTKFHRHTLRNISAVAIAQGRPIFFRKNKRKQVSRDNTCILHL